MRERARSFVCVCARASMCRKDVRFASPRKDGVGRLGATFGGGEE